MALVEPVAMAVPIDPGLQAPIASPGFRVILGLVHPLDSVAEAGLAGEGRVVMAVVDDHQGCSPMGLMGMAIAHFAIRLYNL